MKNNTIAAISTAPLPAGIAVVRVSGQDSINIVDKIFKSKKPLSEAFSHTIHYGKIVSDNTTVDEVLVSVMKAPKTYTGEDVVEISCHGSMIVQKKILSLLLHNGASLAEPGEFTKRAFLNGKMDLTQAEAVMDIIHSENESALKSSILSLSGEFATKIADIREKIIYEIAFIESALDDPEHISLEGYSQKLDSILTEILREIDLLISNANLSEKIVKGIDCAIIGNTNVGKSSLLNAICGEDRAIVTNIPGTTRDIINTHVNMGDFTLNIIDTAGIRESNNEVEKIGINKSLEYKEIAQIVLYVIDSSVSLSDDVIGFIKNLNNNSIIVLNKSDLKCEVDSNLIMSYTSLPIVNVSAKNFVGLQELKEAIYKLIFDKDDILSTNNYSINERQKLLLQDSRNSILNVFEAIQSGFTEDIFTVDLTDAYESLGKILGIELSDDIINEIFSKFCIGK